MIANNPGTPSPGSGGMDVVYSIRIDYDKASKAAVEQAAKDLKGLETANERTVKSIQQQQKEQERMWDRFAKGMEAVARGTEKQLREQERAHKKLADAAQDHYKRAGRAMDGLAGSVEGVGRSMVLFGLSTTKNLEEGVQAWAKFEATVLALRGPIEIVAGLVTIYREMRAASLAAAAANEVLAASQIHVATSAGAAGVGGAASGAGGFLSGLGGAFGASRLGGAMRGVGAAGRAGFSGATGVLSGAGALGTAAAGGLALLGGGLGLNSMFEFATGRRGGQNDLVGGMMGPQGMWDMGASVFDWGARFSGFDPFGTGATMRGQEQMDGAAAARSRADAFNGSLDREFMLGMQGRMGTGWGRGGLSGLAGDKRQIDAQVADLQGSLGGASENRALMIRQSLTSELQKQAEITQRIKDNEIQGATASLSSAKAWSDTMRGRVESLMAAESAGTERFGMMAPGRQALLNRAAGAVQAGSATREQLALVSQFRDMFGPEFQQKFAEAFARAAGPAFDAFKGTVGFTGNLGNQENLLSQALGAMVGAESNVNALQQQAEQMADVIVKNQQENNKLLIELLRKELEKDRAQQNQVKNAEKQARVGLFRNLPIG